MKKIMLALASGALMLSSGLLFAGMEESLQKQTCNDKVLKAATAINALDLNLSENDIATQKDEILKGFDDPMQLVRLMIVCKYIAYPGSIGEEAIDLALCPEFFYRRLGELSSHKNFAGALSFIHHNMRLDAGPSEIFSEFLYEHRENPSVMSDENLARRVRHWMSYEEKMDYFCSTENKHKSIQIYAPGLQRKEQVKFSFEALDRLVSDPQRASLKYIWKMEILSSYLESLDSAEISPEYVPVLFKALKARSAVLTADRVFAECIEKIAGGNPGYNLEYMKSFKGDEDERLAIISQWESIFEQKKSSADQ